MEMPDFMGLKFFSTSLPLSDQLADMHHQLTVLVESGEANGAYLRQWLMAFELAMCARVTQARFMEEQMAMAEAQRPRALAWMRSKYRGGV